MNRRKNYKLRAAVDKCKAELIKIENQERLTCLEGVLMCLLIVWGFK